jgi:hypothetical protein
MAVFSRDPGAPTKLGPYLLQGERVVVAVHQHWSRVVEPIVSAFLAFVVALWVDANLTVSTQFVGTVVWVGFLLVLARGFWKFAEWRYVYFVATDKRLLLRQGLIVHKVAMMPLLKVTDMSYLRTLGGQILGYGTFVMESAGQDQALKRINWVPNPDETYRLICAELFHVTPVSQEQDDVLVDLDEDFVEEEQPLTFGRPTSYPDVPAVHNPIQDRLDSYGRERPDPGPAGITAVASELLRRRRRSARTGPIPIDPGDD